MGNWHKQEKQTIYRIRPLFLSYGSGLTSQTLLVVVFVAVLSLKLAFLVRTQNTKSNKYMKKYKTSTCPTSKTAIGQL